MAGREISAAALPPALQHSLRRVRRAAYTSDMTRAYERGRDVAGREGRVGVMARERGRARSASWWVGAVPGGVRPRNGAMESDTE
ncbi:hypothetical protein GCM10010384_15020 [Streptomyces djakartensis]|uniref:Uncharacterized protein n=1 Tax=Streptomyces djakartensis TaxID=68193 RepID=A0ABQ2ZB57_9ACTN|nr:hypothetical protein GCM10010384_15020 [Streptomyces djakartensis]